MVMRCYGCQSDQCSKGFRDYAQQQLSIYTRLDCHFLRRHLGKRQEGAFAMIDNNPGTKVPSHCKLATKSDNIDYRDSQGFNSQGKPHSRKR